MSENKEHDWEKQYRQADERERKLVEVLNRLKRLGVIVEEEEQ